MGDTISGTAAVVGDYVSADVVLPGRHSFLPPEEMAGHVLEELDPTANARVRAATVLIAGYAFGYATGRESPARALRAAGIRAIVGGPFARMLYRNAINNGILVAECPEIAAAGIPDGAEVEIDLDAGEIRCEGTVYDFSPVPRVVRDIVAAGGLVDYGRRLLAESEAGT